MRALPPLSVALSGSVALACRSRPRACSLRAAVRLGTPRVHPAPSLRAPLRCFAAQRDGRDGRGGEKSWGELLADAKELATCV
jgi:hypothetical protein